MFRIAPLFYAVLAVTILRYDVLLHQSFSKSTVALNLGFLFNLIPGRQEGIVWASWTIGVEMLFYLFFLPIIRTPMWVQLLIGVASVVGFSAECAVLPTTYDYWLFLGYFPLFLIGMWSFALFERWKAASSPILSAALIGIGLVALASCMAAPLAEKNVALRVPIGLGYAALLVGCGLARPALFEAPLLRFYGKISYSMYLIHAPMIYALSGVFVRITDHTSAWASYPLCAAAAVLVVTPFAYLCYRWIEAPGERLGRMVVRRVTKVASATMEAPSSFIALTTTDAPRETPLS